MTPHLQENLFSCQNAGAVEQGAYSNGNRYRRIFGWRERGDRGAGIIQNAAGKALAWPPEAGGGVGQRFTDVHIDMDEGPAWIISGHNLDPDNFVEIIDSTLIAGPGAATILVKKLSERFPGPKPLQKFRNCTKAGGAPLTADDVVFDSSNPGADPLTATSMQGCQIYVVDSEGDGWLVSIEDEERTVTPVTGI